MILMNLKLREKKALVRIHLGSSIAEYLNYLKQKLLMKRFKDYHKIA